MQHQGSAKPVQQNLRIITATLLACSLLSQLGYAQSILSHYTWQEPRTYQPLSRTSKSITGSLTISKESGSLYLHLGGKGPFHLLSQGIFYREWGSDLSGKKITAEVFKIDRDPGQLLNGNSLCGDTKARYLVFYEDLLYDTHLLEVVIFSSQAPPMDIKSEGLCGTFNYSVMR